MPGLLGVEDAAHGGDDLRGGHALRLVENDPAVDRLPFLRPIAISLPVRGIAAKLHRARLRLTASPVGEEAGAIRSSSSSSARSRCTSGDLRMVSIFSASAKDLSSTKRRSGVNLSAMHVAHLAAQKALVAVERGDDRVGVLAAQRLAKDRGMAHVGRRLDLRDCHRHAVQIGIADVVRASALRPAHGAAFRRHAIGAAMDHGRHRGAWNAPGRGWDGRGIL